MTQKTLPSTGAAANAKQPVSPIKQIRRGPRPLLAYTKDSAHTSVTTDSTATAETTTTAAYSVDTSILDQLIAGVRSCARDRYLKEREVVTTIGRSKAAMRRDVSFGRFPAPIKISVKSSRWRESEVMAWIEATTILSRTANPGFSMDEFVAALMASRSFMLSPRD